MTSGAAEANACPALTGFADWQARFATVAIEHQAGVEPGMDARVELLSRVREQGLDRGHFLGLLHIVIGRRIESADGAVVSSGVTWRDLAALLKKTRWAKEAVRELGMNPGDMPMRDRERFWYSAIAHAGVDSAAAAQAGDALAELLKQEGYTVGPAPGSAGRR